MSAQSTQEMEGYRPLLEGLAYRMCGSRRDAEEVAQDVFLRWLQLEEAERAEINNPRAWLVKVGSRLAIDRLRTRQRERESYVGPWLPEPWLVEERRTPAENAAMADSVTFAMMLVMERLSPWERVAFLLHDVFGFSFAEVAQVLDKTPATCRQLASRGRKALRAEGEHLDYDTANHERLLNAFAKATEEGDTHALMSILTEDVVIFSDGGGLAAAARKVLHSKDIITRLFMGVGRRMLKNGIELETRVQQINGLPSLLFYENGRLTTLMGLSVQQGRIAAIFQQRNPLKLEVLQG